ncbi:MAG: ribosome-associated translation inhibitor RaiA [Bacilli bacterium]|nr:ribosome-associated translation inhibitor RaiA [Bacilli bacterium]
MKINLRGDKLVVTDAIKSYVEDKISKLEKYFDIKDLEAKIIIKVSNNKEIIEVTIPTNKYTLRAEERNDDLYAAIDLVVDKLERQIRKNKTKLNNRYKKENNMDFNFDFIDSIESDDEETTIIKRKEIDVKPMDEEEAILQMELLNHDFFMFKNIDEECISVLYKRKDGEYGIINAK